MAHKNKNKPSGWSRTNTLESGDVFKEWTRRGFSHLIAILRPDRNVYTIINENKKVLGTRDNMHEAHMFAYSSMVKVVADFERGEALRLTNEPEWDGDDSCSHRTVGDRCDVHKREVICGYLGPFISWCGMRTKVPVEIENELLVSD